MMREKEGEEGRVNNKRETVDGGANQPRMIMALDIRDAGNAWCRALPNRLMKTDDGIRSTETSFGLELNYKRI